MRFLRITLFIIVQCLLLLSAYETFAQNGNAGNLPETETPELIVSRYINALGQRDFKKAYSYINSPKWGSESQFSSKRFNGGITEAYILEKPVIENCLKEVGGECVKAKVFVKYFAKDPTNDTKRCEAAGKVYDYFFFLEKQKSQWKIIDGTLDEQTCNPSPPPAYVDDSITLNEKDTLPPETDTTIVDTTTVAEEPGKSVDNASDTKEDGEENIEFTDIFNPKYWYIYVILGMALLLIGMLSFIPLKLFR